MKGLLQGFMAVSGLATLVWVGLPARAESFNCTNCLPPATAVSGWPTNTVATNQVGQGTGGPISLANQDWAGFYFAGYCATNLGTAGTIQVTLVRSMAAGPPRVVYGTNAFSGTNVVLLCSDWETYSNALPPLTLTIPINTTNAIYWTTNLDRWALGGAQWVGIGSVTNSATNMFLTNVVMGLNKKIIPLRYP